MHVEVQGQPQPDFPERMFVYYAHVFLRHRKPVVSIAVLTDQDPSWRPEPFDGRAYGSGCRFVYRVVKLTDFEKRQEELEQSNNPFAVLILAHLKALRSRPDQQRLEWKVDLVRRLVRAGWGRDIALELLRLVDWFLSLPPPLQARFDGDLLRISKEESVPFIMSFERKAEERGRRQGRTEGRTEGRREGLRDSIIRWLEHRGFAVPDELRAPVRDPSISKRLERCLNAILTGADEDEVLALLAGERVRARRRTPRPRHPR